MNARATFVLSVLALTACASQKASAPPPRAAIEGRVTMPAIGDVLPGARVAVVSDDGKLRREAVTDRRGRYEVTDLPAGRYDVLVEKKALRGEHKDVVVAEGERRQVPVEIDVPAPPLAAAGSPPEPIESREQAPTIDPGSTQNVPSRGRRWHQSMEAPPGDQGDTYGTSLSGSTSIENSTSEEKDRRIDNAREWIEGQPADEIWVIARSGVTPTTTASAGLGSGQMRVTRGAGPADENHEVVLPLESTDVRARILGYIASVDVKQRYANPYRVKIDVEYVFPLPANAAVADFVMTIGARRIRGVVRDRAEATEIYEEARRAGHVASLLTEERPNVFTQKLANLEPRHAIDVELTYFNTLPLEDGAFTFAFPMVVGPRYNPGGSADPAPTVSYLAPDQRSQHRLSLTVELDGGAPLSVVDSPTHIVEVQTLSERRRVVTLAQGKVMPNKDFVLRYALQGKTLHPTFFHDGDTFAFVLQPPGELGALARAPMEMVFVIDCSGSMSGRPLEAAKRTVRNVLERLVPEDTFQIITFSESASALGPRPVAATPENLARARRWLESLDSEGGTEMLRGINAALDYPPAAGRMRLVTFLTDGYIGNEAEILAAISRRIGSSRIFSFGVGTSVNRYLLERMAAFGRGAVAFVGMGDRAEDEAAVAAFYERMSHPALTDVSVDWNGMDVAQVFPARIPDLVVGRPVVVTGKLRGKPAPEIRVSGRAGGQLVTVRVPIERITPHPALVKVWARAGIGDLFDKAIVAADARPYAAQIKDVALRNGLVSPFTAFVAVDAATKTSGAAGTLVPVAVPVPEGVRYDRTVGQGSR